MNEQDAPRFSVVIPAYNSTETIGATLDSVLAQTSQDFELIVVDDGSSDRTPDLVQEYCAADPHVTLIQQENQGTAGARNTGIDASRGEFISLLDNDDLWMPTYLDAMFSALEADPGAGFAYTDAWVLNDATKRIERRGCLEHYPPVPAGTSAEEFLFYLIEINFVMSSTTIRRAALKEVGGFDTSIRGVDDYDLWLRIVTAGWRAVQARGKQLIQRDHDSQSKDELLMIDGLRATMRRVIGTDATPEPVREVARGHIADLDRWERTVTGRDRLRFLALKARLLAARPVKAVMPSRGLRTSPPPEIAAAFPELANPDR